MLVAGLSSSHADTSGRCRCGSLLILTVAFLVAGCASSSSHTVQRVIDGDTVTIEDGQRVRLIGIDAPERDECGYNEATQALEQLTPPGSELTFESDRQQPGHDRYGRILTYVITATGEDAGLAMIGDGWAVLGYDFDRQSAYQAAARDARKHHRGIYALCD